MFKVLLKVFDSNENKYFKSSTLDFFKIKTIHIYLADSNYTLSRYFVKHIQQQSCTGYKSNELEDDHTYMS